MPARTGKQFLKGLRGAREVWVDGERVSDVVDHPKLSGAAHALAEVFDLHHEHAEVCLMPDPETGEPIPVSHMIPRSREDLARRGKALRQVAEYSMGLMGRTPDYMNVTYAGFAGRPDEWGLNGNEAGAERLIAYQKFLRRGDISLTHTIVQPTVDKATGDAPAPGNVHALHKVADTEHGIVVRGARVLATLAPFADELAVYPAAPLPEGADAYALSFCVPMGAPGLKFMCRDSVSAPANRFDHPLSSRFDEQDAFVIFDDVEVPRDRVFIDCNRAAYNKVPTTSWSPNIQQQTMIRASTKLDFAWGLALRMAAAINAADPETMRMIGEIWAYAEFTRAAVATAEAEAREWPGGLWTLGERAAACAARHAAAVVPAGERDPAPDRLAQRLCHADRRADGRQGPAAADRPLSARRQGHGWPRSASASSAWCGISPAARSPAATSSTSASTSPPRRATLPATSPSPTAAVPTGWSTAS